MQDKITTVLKAIADPKRREIFHALIIASSALSITQISGQFDISRQGVTKHIKTLEEAGLVEITSKGRERFCTADANPLKQVTEWVMFYEKFWDKALGDLGAFLDGK
ncbi:MULTISPECIES: ArsR/SmtB family transcription factor [Flavobacteriaceae]|uniref:ArsR/SmtB family transcription factor n=1 Tax=Flavobacteriaceae TaxID=49546 RepID=UPI0014916168|nr:MULTISPECIES: metalloregulator ArsR/SmtB family transcription factor [Allomuricauda]MDC6364675.1 metalloregulator ArsR/SmtB family transcription factor [Muricauda sp. AC10]